MSRLCVKCNRYISGGYSHGNFTANLLAYSPTTDQWEELRPMNAPRGWHCMATVGENTANSMTRLFVFGGCVLNTNPLNATPTIANTVSPNTPLTLTPPNTGNHLIQTAQPVTLTEYYTPLTNQWTIVKPMINLHKEASCFTFNSHIYILGGYNIQLKTGQKLVTKYDPENDSWLTVGQLNNGMTGVGACVLDLPWHVFDENATSTSSPAQSHIKSYLDLEEESSGDESDATNSSSSCHDDQNDDEEEEEYLEWSTQTSLQSDDTNDRDKEDRIRKQFRNATQNKKKGLKCIRKSSRDNTGNTTKNHHKEEEIEEADKNLEILS